MKWPQDARIAPAVREGLESRIAQFLSEDASSDGGKDGRAVQKLLLDLYAIYTSLAGTEAEELSQFNLILAGVTWDTDEPRFAHAQKYINRLFSDQIDEAHAYIDKAINERATEDYAVGKTAIAEAGARGGKAKHQEAAAAIERAMAFCERHHAGFKSKKDMARYCEKHFPPVKYTTYYRMLRKL